MIAEVLLVLAGHSSSLFPTDHKIHPSFAPLLHPGERQCLESLGLVALRYRKIKEAANRLSTSPSRYVCALCATLNSILKGEYETLVVDLETKVLRRDASTVGSGSFVPLSSIRAVFAEWDAPMAALVSLVDELETEPKWLPGPLVDMLILRSRTGVHKIADIFSRLSVAVQLVWRTQLTAFIVHGSLASVDPLAEVDYILLPGTVPSCVSEPSRESIAYAGRAVGTVKAAKWQKQLPRSLAAEHTTMLEKVLPQEQHEFDLVIAQIRTNVSEWLWINVLTQRDVEDAVDSLANYFLLRNGEFSLSLIREIERLKLSRLTAHVGPSSTMIRDQDLNLALLRASLGTNAQHDPSLAHLKFSLPLGPLRPLLPSLAAPVPPVSSPTEASTGPDVFNSHLLGTPLVLSYAVSWPLDLFLHSVDLAVYGNLFSYLSALRKTHTRIHTCWTSLSNAQRARRRWTGLGEGGTSEDLELRRKLLRCGWGIVRDMSWFLDTLLGYVMTDVVEVEYRRLRDLLGRGKTSTSRGEPAGLAPSQPAAQVQPSQVAPSASNLSNASSTSQHLDFTSLRAIHATYLDRLLTACLLTNPALTSILRSLLGICEQFVAQVERWGGDILPPLLFEGSIRGEDEEIGGLVRQRWAVVAEINQSLHDLLESFYGQLSESTSQQPFTAPADASKSVLLNASVANMTAYNNISSAGKGLDGGVADVRRHVERLLLRLDFNGVFSAHVGRGRPQRTQVLMEGGLA